jgi:hypothetical protein
MRGRVALDGADCPRVDTQGKPTNMLPDQHPDLDPDQAPEERLSSVRLFVIRNGRLVELERRERTANKLSEPSRPYLASPAKNRD